MAKNTFCYYKTSWSSNQEIPSIIKYIVRAIGLSLFVYIVNIIDYSILNAITSKIKWHYLGIAAFFLFIQILVKSQRWRSINKTLDIRIPFSSTIKVSTIAGLLGSLTPGRLGELVKVRFIKNYSTSQISIWTGVILDRIFDLIVLFIIGIISLFLLAQFVSFGSNLTIVIMIIFLTILIIFSRHFENVILMILKILVSNEILFSIKSRYQEFLNRFFLTFKKVFFQGFIYTGISFIIQCLLSLSIVYSIGLQVPLYFIVILISVSALVSLLPISVGGFGTREGIYILLLSQQGISKEAALAFAFIDGVIICILFQGILAFTFWATNRFTIEF